MMDTDDLVITDWSPDTCDCTIRCTSTADGDYYKGETVRKCDAHANHPDHDEHLTTLLAENRMKNELLAHLKANHPKALLANQLTAPLTTYANAWAAAYDLAGQLTFDTNRNLLLQTNGLQAIDLATIQSHCDATWGAGKVKVK